MENELYHYGVPGMKWGVRKANDASSGNTKRKAKNKPLEATKRYKERMTKAFHKTAHGVGRYTMGMKGLGALTLARGAGKAIDATARYGIEAAAEKRGKTAKQAQRISKGVMVATKIVATTAITAALVSKGRKIAIELMRQKIGNLPALPSPNIIEMK